MVNKTKLGLVDPQTGELLERVYVIVGRRAPSPCTGGFMLNVQMFMEEFSVRKDIGLQEWRVLGILLARLEFNNLIQLPQTEIAEALGMRKQHVHRTMKRLEELGVILRGPKVGRSCSYRLNPNVGWKGKSKDHRKALKELMDARGMRVVE